MRKLFFLVLMVCLTIGAVSLALAAQGGSPSHAGKMIEVKGVVVSVDASAHTMVVKDSFGGGSMTREITFSLGESAKVMSQGKPATMNDLKPGSSVKVRYTAKDGALEAHEIHISMH